RGGAPEAGGERRRPERVLDEVERPRARRLLAESRRHLRALDVLEQEEERAKRIRIFAERLEVERDRLLEPGVLERQVREVPQVERRAALAEEPRGVDGLPFERMRERAVAPRARPVARERPLARRRRVPRAELREGPPV